MSWQVWTSLKLVFIILFFNLLLIQNIFNASPVGVTAAALETGLQIESLKSEQEKALEKREGNYERNLFSSSRDFDATESWREDNQGLGETRLLSTWEDPKEKRALQDDPMLALGSEHISAVTNSSGTSNHSETLAKEVLQTILNDFGKSTSEGPNIVTPTFNLKDLDLFELQNQQANGRRTQDTLRLKFIEEDLNFDWGDEKVLEWIHLRHDSHDYYIGRRLQDLLLILEADEQQDTAMVINVGQAITSVVTYSQWNFEYQLEEGIILLATSNEVLVFRNNPENQEFELVQKWSLPDRFINQIKYFSKDFQHYLIISSNLSALDINTFDLKTKVFKKVQSLQLDYPCQEVRVIKTEQEVLLAISQPDKVALYTDDPQSKKIASPKFRFKEFIEAKGLLSMEAFRIGSKNYLTLGGSQPQILIYQQGHFLPQTLFDREFGFVDLILPIPIRTYRDDLLLLVQRTSHNLTSLEILIWEGAAFSSSLPVPCHRGSQVDNSADCMLNLEQGQSLKGAALLTRKHTTALIVPYLQGKSKLFHFHTEILPKNSHYLDLQEAFEFLKDWLQEQDELIAEAQQFLDTPAEKLPRVPDEIPALDYVETPELEFSGEVQDIFLNDYKWSQEDSEIDLNLLINSIEELEKSLSSGRQRRELDLDEVVYDELTLDVVMAEELEIEQHNGSPFYIKDGVLEFPGEIQVSELEVLQTVEHMKKRAVKKDFQFEGDLEFDYINDLKWSDFRKNIVLRNQEQELDYLRVEGVVIVEDVLQIKTLNNLSFPEDYLVSSGPRSSIVRAEKYFNNTLSASSVDTDGLINGQNPVEAITLMDSQEWLGSPIFNHLEVSEKLELHGTAHGRNVDNFPSNPTLQESNVVEADCVFNELQVNGPIVIKGDLDDKPLGDLLKDILQRPEDPLQEIVVPSPKFFDLIMFPLDFELENNTVNKIPTEKFVTVQTPQTLSLDSLDGYVYFYNLTLKGLYDGIRIEDVVKDVISLDKPLDLSQTELIFENDLQAETLIILNRINGLPIQDNLQTLEEDLRLKTAEFDDLHSKTAEFSEDIMGPGKLNNIELHDFVNERSWHEPPVQGNLFLNELYAAQGLQTDELHGLNAENLLDFLHKIDELPEMVLNGQIQVDHITVTGDVQLHKVNGLMFDEDIQMTSIWLNRPNYLSISMAFKEPLSIKGNLRVKGNYQGVSMSDFMTDIVLKKANSSRAFITSPKSFLKPVYVLQNSHIEALNGLRFDDIALKTKENIFKGSVKIKGKLLSSALAVQGLVNGASLAELDKILYYDDLGKNFVLRNEIQFKNPIFLEDLSVLGNFGDLPNLESFFQDLIYKTSRCHLQGNNTFTGRVSVEQGAYIFQLNGLDLRALIENLIFIHDTEPVFLKAPVLFEGPVKSKKLSIRKALKTKSLNGCLLEEWLNNTLRVDQDQYIPHFLKFSEGALDGNPLKVHFINDLDLARIVTLNTPQKFQETVKFSELYLRGNVNANGSVNGVNLEEEYNNTLMIYGGQHITTPLTIQSIQVLQDLQVLAVVNGNKNLSDVATLDHHLDLESPVYFQTLYSPKVLTKDLVTGIDFNKWFETSLRVRGKDTHYITGNWSARSLTVKSGPYNFEYTINGFEPWQYNAFIRSARSYEPEEDREEICTILKEIWQKIERKTIELKYIEEAFEMQLENYHSSTNSHRKLFHLPVGTKNFLLLNVDCQADLFEWNLQQQKFVHRNSYESGPIAQVLVIAGQNSSIPLQFITNYETTEALNCSSQKGVNLWTSHGKETRCKNLFPEEVMDLQRSKTSEATVRLLSHDLVREVNLNSLQITKKWRVPFKDPSQHPQKYSFVHKEDSEEILISNGLQMVSVTERRKTKTKKQIFDFILPALIRLTPPWLGFQVYETVSTSLPSTSSSLLKPNTTMARKFAFTDFKEILTRMLLDLSQKLQQQINITQLSIPESDLFDEHLIPDFVATMDQLQHQAVVAPGMLNINFEEIGMPETPAQVLAARVIQIVWPVVEELEEIHAHLKDNETHNHPLCSNITNLLGKLMSEVLREANGNPETGEQSEVLFKVIECIRDFDEDLHAIVKALNQKPGEADEEDKLLVSASNQKSRIVKSNQENLHLKGNFLEKEELLTLKVGAFNNSRHLMAVTKTFNSLTPGQDSSIHLYGEDLQGNPYQIINVKKPRSLIHLRVHQETLLMFIENCCQVQVLRYQGTQGFVRFAHIHSDDHIQQILTVSLALSEGKHFLALLTDKKVKFYEIRMQGSTQTPPALPCP